MLFDSNVSSNEKVQAAVHAFTRQLQSRGAIVRLPVLPKENRVNGPDDFLALHQDQDLAALLNEAKTATADEDFLNMLARLPRIEYDRQREGAAAQLGIRVTTLDLEVDSRRPAREQPSGNGAPIMLEDPELYPEPVDGAALAETLIRIFRRFLVLPVGADVALALFTLHTCVLEAAEASPIIAVTSPEKRCGKTVVLEILQSVTRRPLPAANITTAALFRTIEALEPTLLIDEADSFLKDNEELRGVLNSGHRRATAVIIRTTGDHHEPKMFSTWCAKAIALIGKLPGTLEDRSILIAMQRKARHEKVERLRNNVLVHQTKDVRRMAARWSADNIDALTLADPEIPAELNDRAADCWRPLLAIADALGNDWPESSRKAALALSSVDGIDDSSITVQLLAGIEAIFGQAEKLWSEMIVNQLAEMEDRPWPDWKHGKPITKTQLARLLGRFNIKPKNIRIGTDVNKGYLRNQFDDAFARYLGISSATPLHSTTGMGFSDFKNATEKNHVAGEKTNKPHDINGVADVADQNPENWGEERV